MITKTIPPSGALWSKTEIVTFSNIFFRRFQSNEMPMLYSTHVPTIMVNFWPIKPCNSFLSDLGTAGWMCSNEVCWTGGDCIHLLTCCRWMCFLSSRVISPRFQLPWYSILKKELSRDADTQRHHHSHNCFNTGNSGKTQRSLIVKFTMNHER